LLYRDNLHFNDSMEASGQAPCEDMDLLDLSYLAAAYLTKYTRIQLGEDYDTVIMNVDTWSNKTIQMRCISRAEATRYLRLLGGVSRAGGRLLPKMREGRPAQRRWRFKFIFPGGELQEQF